MPRTRANTLRAYLVYSQRRGETNAATRRRIAAFLGYSDSTLRRSLKNDKISDKLWDKIVKAIRLEPYQRQASIYYCTRMLERSSSALLRRRLDTFNQQYSRLRKDTKRYRQRIMRTLRQDDRVLASNLRIPIRVIRLYTDTP